MDADHRHELKENDLAEFITHFGQWWSKHGNKLLLSALVISVVILGRQWLHTRSAAAQENAWADLAGATSPDSYRLVALSHDNPTVRAMAYLRGADLLLNEAVAGPGDDDNTANDSAKLTAQQSLQEAAAMYNQVIQDNQAPLAFHLNAGLGLAAVAEGQRDWPQAKQLYEQVIDQAGAAFPTIAHQAQARLDMLDRLREPVVFAPDPPKEDTVFTPPSLTPDVKVPSLLLPDGDTPDNPPTEPQ